MANPPPPYDDITGISRTVMKDNAQETLVNYNGNARPGEIVVDLTTNPPTPYIGNNVGQLTLLTSAGAYGNVQVGQYLAAAQVGNIIPSGNAVYTLGNATNQWSDVYVSNATIYLNNIPVGLTSANVLTVNGNAVLSNNSNVAITTTGNIAANYFIGNGSLLTGISGSGNTGNVTFNNVNIIGTGNLNLQPDSGNSEYLNIYLTLADDIHIAGTGNVILGTDEQANIAVLSDGNVTIQAGNVGGTNTWAFDTAGNLTLPRGGVVYETNIPDGGLNGNTIALTPSGGTNADQQLLIYPTTNDANHLHLTSGNLYNTELFLGDDNLYVKLANTGNIVVNSNDDNGNTAQWTFGTDDSLTLPKNSIISETTPATGAAASINVNQSASSIPNGLFVSLPPATVSNYNVPGTDIIVTVTWVANGPSYYAPRFAVVDGGTGHTPGGQFGGGEVLTVPYIDMGITGGGNWTWYVETIASNLILEAGLNSWTFSGDGNLTDPGGMIISGNINTLGTQTALLQPTNNLPLSFISSGANGSVTSYWAEDFGNLMTSNIAAIYTPLQGSQTVRIVTGTNGGNIAIYDFDPDGMFTTAQISATGNVYAGNVSASGNVTGNYFIGKGSQLTDVNAVTVDVTDTNGLTTIYYPTFVENRTTAQIARADVDLTYRTDENLLTVGNVSASGNVTGNYFIGNGSQLTDVAASVPSQTILPTVQTITVATRPAGLFGGGQGGANVTVANAIPVTEYGVIITDGTVSEKYKTGSLGSIPGTVSLTFTTGLNSAQFTVFAYVTSNAGTYYSNATTGTSGICLLAGTQIALSDGTRKAIEHITYTDKMLSWDFDRGCYAETTAVWIKRGETGSQYNLLSFSDGTTLRTFDQHRIFNKQAGAFTYPMTDATPIGTVTVSEHGQEITLTNKQVIVDTIEYYNVITDHHMNLFSDTVLTSCRFNNIYPITDMKFVKDGRKLRTRAEFENIPDRFFYGLRLAEQTTDIKTVEWYVNRLLSTEVLVASELTV